MRSVEETIDFLNSSIKKSGMMKKDVLEKAGLSSTVFTMALNRHNYLRLEAISKLADVLNISIADILGVNELPQDIQEMVNMLQQLSPESRKMISMNINNYYQVEVQNKDKS